MSNPIKSETLLFDDSHLVGIKKQIDQAMKELPKKYLWLVADIGLIVINNTSLINGHYYSALVTFHAYENI
jgi:hypothetical protein